MLTITFYEQYLQSMNPQLSQTLLALSSPSGWDMLKALVCSARAVVLHELMLRLQAALDVKCNMSICIECFSRCSKQQLPVTPVGQKGLSTAPVSFLSWQRGDSPSSTLKTCALPGWFVSSITIHQMKQESN
jgi:hypothetical protein